MVLSLISHLFNNLSDYRAMIKPQFNNTAMALLSPTKKASVINEMTSNSFSNKPTERILKMLKPAYQRKYHNCTLITQKSITS